MTRIRILIADDHAIFRRGLRELLASRSGWEICGEASNGRDAIHEAQRHKPEVAILDVRMPVLNGLEAARRIAKELPRTEILILTMDTSEEVAHQVLQAGARGYLLKSDAESKLVDAVETLGQHKPYLTPAIAELVLDKYVERKQSIGDGIANQLSPREREIVQLLAEGKSNKEAAAVLQIAVKTVEAHRANIMHKLCMRSLSELVRYAIRKNIIAA